MLRVAFWVRFVHITCLKVIYRNFWAGLSERPKDQRGLRTVSATFKIENVNMLNFNENNAKSKSGVRDFVIFRKIRNFFVFVKQKNVGDFVVRKSTLKRHRRGTSSTWLGTIIFGFSGFIYPRESFTDHFLVEQNQKTFLR